MIFATLASYYLRLSDVYGVSTITHIPQGLPLPQLPPYQIMPQIMGRTFSIAVVASAILISLAKIYATKHRYSVDDNQELIALGAANVFGGVFMCLPTSGGLARSAVQDSVGGSTQVRSSNAIVCAQFSRYVVKHATRSDLLKRFWTYNGHEISSPAERLRESIEIYFLNFFQSFVSVLASEQHTLWLD